MGHGGERQVVDECNGGNGCLLELLKALSGSLVVLLWAVDAQKENKQEGKRVLKRSDDGSLGMCGCCVLACLKGSRTSVGCFPIFKKQKREVSDLLGGWVFFL